MRITCPKQVIFEYYSGIYTTGGFEPRVQCSAKAYDSAADLMELGQCIKPLFEIGEFSVPGIFAQYCYAPDDHVDKNSVFTLVSWENAYKFGRPTLKKDTLDCQGKLWKLAKMTMENFKASERYEKLIYRPVDYCREMGISQSNYDKIWSKKERAMTNGLRDLSNEVIEPIRQRINEINNLKKAC